MSVSGRLKIRTSRKAVDNMSHGVHIIMDHVVGKAAF